MDFTNNEKKKKKIRCWVPFDREQHKCDFQMNNQRVKGT